MTTTKRFTKALTYAAEAHAMQLRKGTEIPYLSHLLAVSGLVMEYGGDEHEAIAGLLHDAVEDAGGAERLADIREQFGERVASIVDGCSDTDQVPKPPWRERKIAYIDHLGHASPSVLLVSACDKLHNARTILADLRSRGAVVFERFNGGQGGSLWYYRALVDAFRENGADGGLVAELDRVVSELEVLSK